MEFSGILRLDNDWNPDAGGHLQENLRFQKFELQATVHAAKDLPLHLGKELLFVVRSRMEQDLIVNGRYDPNHLQAVDYLKEAYFQFVDVNEAPINLTVGTTEVTYGQDYDGTISLQSDANHAMSDPDRGQVKGVTVSTRLPQGALIDQAEAGFFTSSGEFTRGGLAYFDGSSFRLTKIFGRSVTLEGSMLHKENGYDHSLRPETDVSLGAIYHRDQWVLWSELFALKNSPVYPAANRGATGGVSRITGPGRLTTNLVLIEHTLRQYALGYDLYLSPGWTVGPVVRYTDCAGGNMQCVAVRGYGEGMSYGISARYILNGENPVWLGKL